MTFYMDDESARLIGAVRRQMWRNHEVDARQLDLIAGPYNGQWFLKTEDQL